MVLLKDEIKALIEEALTPVKEDIKNLPNMDCIDNLVNALSTNLTVQFETRFEDQDARIKALEERLEIQKSSMAVLQKLEERVDKKMEDLEKLEQRVENGEQYSRRLCLRLYNLDLPQDGSKEDCLQKVESVLEELECGVTIDMVDRAHRIGERSVDDDGKIRQQMIVKFRCFRERTMVYRARRKAATAKLLDLTKQRLRLLQKAKDLVEARKDILDYAFADINCSLAVKLKNGNFVYFTSIEGLKSKLPSE
eukprot:Seg5655.2 transcript_id=Seg5655.2/GoldUCD/mRNA.D3Y31 product="hypothetical protein" protein_id=Seg5655.2/GoldUCD/D3Y31